MVKKKKKKKLSSLCFEKFVLNSNTQLLNKQINKKPYSSYDYLIIKWTEPKKNFNY